MVEIILSKSEAVQLYGTSKQIAHFQKYNRFVNKNLEESLFKTLQQNFEIVNRIQKGRGFEYEVLDKRKELSARPSKNSRNGSWSIPYTHDLDKVILLSVDDSPVEGSLGSFCEKLSLYSTIDQYFITRTFKTKSSNELFENINPYIVDLVSQNIKSLEQETLRSLVRLNKLGLIDLTVTYRAVSDTSEFVDLDDELAKFYIRKQKEILEQENISLWFANNLRSNEKSSLYHHLHTDLVRNKISELAKKGFYASYIYKHYVVKVKESRLLDKLDYYTSVLDLPVDNRNFNKLYSDFESSRKQYLLKKINSKLNKIKEKFKNQANEDGEEMFGFRNITNDVLDQYYDLVTLGVAEDRVNEIMSILFKEKDESTDSNNLISVDSSIGFEKHDPSPSRQQQDHPSSYSLAQ